MTEITLTELFSRDHFICENIKLFPFELQTEDTRDLLGRIYDKHQGTKISVGEAGKFEIQGVPYRCSSTNINEIEASICSVIIRVLENVSYIASPILSQ